MDLLQVYDAVKAELKLRGGYIMSPEESKKAAATIIKDGRLNADVVGQKATALARLFGFEVPTNTKVLIGEVTEIGAKEPLSYEKLCPVLGACCVLDCCFSGIWLCLCQQLLGAA